ncbi:MAG: DMT family transporter [Fibrobacter sp.]|nr:DMT family transporter [Fibrobacter sp.]
MGALFLYREGLSPESVLCYRFSIAIVLLALLMCFNRSNFAVKKRELIPLAFLGFLFAVSALGLYASFNYMDAGLACTLLFLYPLEVALIMAAFYKEKLTASVAAAIALSLAGIGLLYRGGEGGTTLSLMGLLLVFVSSLAYAIYIVVVNKADLKMGSTKLTLYVMMFCLLFLLLYSVIWGSGLPPVLQNPSSYGWALMLGFVPTVLSLVFMAKAVKIVGSTPTAIMGGLEPLTAVVIGVCVFGETLTTRLFFGIILVLASVIVLTVKKKG